MYVASVAHYEPFLFLSMCEETTLLNGEEVIMYHVYVLRSSKDNNFYSGFSHDLAQRFEQHRLGKVDSTKDRRPLKLIYYEACLNKQDALKRERYFKTYHGKQHLHKRLKSYLTG